MIVKWAYIAVFGGKKGGIKEKSVIGASFPEGNGYGLG